MVSDKTEINDSKDNIPKVKVTYQSKRSKISQEKEAFKNQTKANTSDLVTDESIGSLVEPKTGLAKSSGFILDDSPQLPKSKKLDSKTNSQPKLDFFVAKKERETTSQSTNVKKRKLSPIQLKASSQWYLALGQKDFTTQCPDCGMSYSRGRAEDERVHLSFHESIVNGITFKTYRNEVFVEIVEHITPLNIISTQSPKKEFGSLRPDAKPAINSFQLPEGSIVYYHGNRLGTYDGRKIEEVCNMVNQSLGSAEIETKRFVNSKVYLYLSKKRKVIGCLIAEPIRQAYLLCKPHSNDKDLGSDDSWSLSDKSQVAVVGVNRLWVLPKFRRRGIASILLKAVQKSFLYGVPNIDSSKIAFSQPTAAGRSTALSFSQGSGVLVYTENDFSGL